MLIGAPIHPADRSPLPDERASDTPHRRRARSAHWTNCYLHYSPRLNPAARPCLVSTERLDGVCGVDNPAYRLGEDKEGRDVFPVAPPDLCNGRIFLAPGAGLEGIQRR